MISVVVPVYNERETIREILGRVKTALAGRDAEIVVVDDGSSDGTREELRSIDGIRLIEHEQNQGKGAALRWARITQGSNSRPAAASGPLRASDRQLMDRPLFY